MKLDNISNSQVEYLISEWIKSDRDRKILRKRLIDGLTYERLSEDMDMSVSQIKRIVYKGENDIFKHLN